MAARGHGTLIHARSGPMNKIVVSCMIASLALMSCSKKTEMNRKLIGAVIKGDAAAMNELIAKGADVNAREENNPGRTALIIASEEDYRDIAGALVSCGADVNAKSTDGSTALMNASAEGNADIVKLLLSKGADVNASDNLGQTALIKAAADGQKETIEILIGSGADLNRADKSGLTAIMKATINGHGEIADLLANKGARITEREKAKIQEAARMNTQGEEVVDTENK